MLEQCRRNARVAVRGKPNHEQAGPVLDDGIVGGRKTRQGRPRGGAHQGVIGAEREDSKRAQR